MRRLVISHLIPDVYAWLQLNRAFAAYVTFTLSRPG